MPDGTCLVPFQPVGEEIWRKEETYDVQTPPPLQGSPLHDEMEGDECVSSTEERIREYVTPCEDREGAPPKNMIVCLYCLMKLVRQICADEHEHLKRITTESDKQWLEKNEDLAATHVKGSQNMGFYGICHLAVLAICTGVIPAVRAAIPGDQTDFEAARDAINATLQRYSFNLLSITNLCQNREAVDQFLAFFQDKVGKAAEPVITTLSQSSQMFNQGGVAVNQQLTDATRMALQMDQECLRNGGEQKRSAQQVQRSLIEMIGRTYEIRT